MASNGFRQELKERQQDANSLVCVGLDPLPEKMPAVLRQKTSLSQEWEKIAQWMIDIVDSTAINSSSGIIFASSDDDYHIAAAEKAHELRDQINAAIP